ncbi:hypothetical protein Tco_1239687, partial [Tanacetum coccineum]
MNRQLLDSQGSIPGMTPAQALIAIQTMVDHSQKWHDGSSSRNIESSSNSKGIAAIVNKLENLGRDMKKMKENVHAIQVGYQICGGAHLDKDCPLNDEVKSVEEVKYREFGRPFPNNNRNDETSREAHDKIIQGLETKVKTLANEVEERVNNGKFKECKTICTEDGSPLYTPFYYSPEEIEYFSSNSEFSDNEKQETDNSGMAKALAALEATLKIKKSLKKRNKDLVENKPRTEEDEEIRMNLRFSALLQNHLPPKEQDPGSFILPCSIGKLDFINALADAPFYDLRMPIILRRPLLSTAHAKVDIFRKSISLEVESEKAIHDKLNDDWFNNTSEDEDDLEGILDYLEPRSYEGFIDLDDEAYREGSRYKKVEFEVSSARFHVVA